MTPRRTRNAGAICETPRCPLVHVLDEWRRMHELDLKIIAILTGEVERLARLAMEG